jgi:hypothetical protein
VLHALQEVLVMGDVQQQGQLRRIGLAFKQGRVQHAVVGAVIVDGRQPRLLRKLIGQTRRAVIPAPTVAAGDAQ